MNRSLMGLPALSARDVEKEALDLEAKRTERKIELRKAAQNYGKKHHVNKIDLDDSTSSSSDEEDEVGEESELPFLINEIKLPERQTC
jgi:hypothetical protein